MSLDSIASEEFLNSIDAYASILDTSGVFIKSNLRQTTIMGYTNNDKIIGSSYEKFRDVPDDILQNFIKEDQQIITHKKSIHFLSYHFFCDKRWHLLLGEKSCIKNDREEVVGIFSQAKDVTNSRLIDLSRHFFEESKKYNSKANKRSFDYYITEQDQILDLSKKEMVILFYFLRGKSSREIAAIIFRSEKTVNFHLETIKNKFNVSSKSLLIEKAIYHGYMNIIPDEVFLFK